MDFPFQQEQSRLRRPWQTFAQEACTTTRRLAEYVPCRRLNGVGLLVLEHPRFSIESANKRPNKVFKSLLACIVEVEEEVE